MKKKMISLLAILGTLAAAAALVFVFRDKLKALFESIRDKFCCDCDAELSCDDFAEEPVEEEPTQAAEPTEEIPAQKPAEEVSEDAE